MFDKILVYENALAETHPALERAIALAKDTDAEIKVVDIVVTAEGAARSSPEDANRRRA